MFVHHKIRDKADAEEVVQEALMTVYKEYSTITFAVSFSAWACKVLDNRILDRLRKLQVESKRTERSQEFSPDSLHTRGDTDPSLRRRLLDCLQKLCRRNLRYARILNLHYLGYKTGEICEKMDVIPETLYSALSKARVMLDRCLETGEVKK